MPLTSDHLRRRLRAARELRGWSQAELTARASAAGLLGKQEAGRVERGDIAWTRKHTLAFMDVLGLPERWFTVESDDELIAGQAAAADAAVSEWERQAAAQPDQPR